MYLGTTFSTGTCKSHAQNSSPQSSFMSLGYITVPSRKRAHYGMYVRPPPTLGSNFLLRSSVNSNMCPCVAALENAAQMAGLWGLNFVRSISNVLQLSLASFIPRFSKNKLTHTASDRSHAHLIELHSTTHGEESQLPLFWIGNRAWIRLKSLVAAATIHIINLAWVTYLGALSHINAILIPRILAHLPILAQCKVHRP